MNVEDSKLSLTDLLLQTIIEKDIDAAVSKYYELKNGDASGYNFKENQLNDLGYQLLQLGKNKEAVEILKLNVEAYPNSSNVYDSLGEAYMVNGNKQLAIENYKKSLELDPTNSNAKKTIEKLQK
ncbi:MAG: tetratricopeptide repeat protein [Ignavibacteria bacterium]